MEDVASDDDRIAQLEAFGDPSAAMKDPATSARGSRSVGFNVFVISVCQMLMSFAFNSLLAVLALFLNQSVGLAESTASFLVNCLITVNFSLAIVGGTLADREGRYKTIVTGFAIALCGYAVLTGAVLLSEPTSHAPLMPSSSGVLLSVQTRLKPVERDAHVKDSAVRVYVPLRRAIVKGRAESSKPNSPANVVRTLIDTIQNVTRPHVTGTHTDVSASIFIPPPLPAHVQPKTPSAITPPPTRKYSMVLLACGFALVCLGNGILLPANSSFVGDQIQPPIGADEVETTVKRAHEELQTSMYRWFYLSFNVGAICGMLGVPFLAASKGYDAAFGLMCLAHFVAIPILIYFGDGFVHVAPQGDSSIGTMLSAMFRPNAGQTSLSFAEIEAVQHLVRIIAPVVVFWALFYNIPSLWTFSAAHMDRRVHLFGSDVSIPAGSVGTLNPLFDIMLIPMLELVVDPILNARKWQPAPLTRMKAGMVCTALALGAAGLLQLRIESSDATTPIFVAWQAPQYLLLSFGEILLSVTALELAYGVAPKSLKGAVMALFFATQAAGNVLVAVAALVNFGPTVDYFFFMSCMFVFLLGFSWLTSDSDDDSSSTAQDLSE